VAVAQHTTHGRAIDAAGVGIPALLEAVLTLLPLDTYAAHGAYLMERVLPQDADLAVPVWEQYQAICDKHEGRTVPIGSFERFKFYDEAKKAFAVVATGERALYGNIVLVKGVLPA